MFSLSDRPQRLGALMLVFMILSAQLTGCATTSPQLGLRDNFKPQAIKRVIIAPFYSTGSFGLSQSQREQLLHRYEEATAQALIQRGYEVQRPRELEHELVERGLWQQWQEGISLEHDLARYFEPDVELVASLLPTQTLTALAKEAQLQAPVLFGQVVYHSRGVCRTSAKLELRGKYGVYVVRHSDAPQALPSPCVVDHAQLKLVSPQRGRTLWYNKALREYLVASAVQARLDENIAALIEVIMSGDRGLKE